MNYYERHLGDYAKDTGHLSILEHGAYTLLMDRYYSTEAGIPDSEKFRVARARSREEKNSVEAVLEEFFSLTDGVWIHKRIDAEIARFRDGEPERELRKANESNRVKRHRDERSALFKQLTEAGEHAPWNIGISELRDMVKRLQQHGHDTDLEPLQDTAPVTPATATQTPDTRHQTPVVKTLEVPTEPCALASTRPQLEPVDNFDPAEQLSCPINVLVDLYHDLMPRNPRCKVLNPARRKAIAARWREAAGLKAFPFNGGYKTRSDGIERWREFFAICADSDFLTGRTRPFGDRPPFIADIDFLFSPSGFAKTLENKYHRETAA